MVRISFIVNYIYINNGWSPWDTRLGGSEEAVVAWSKELHQRGHEVSVFHNGRHGDYEGVMYRDHADYIPGDITINVNHPEFPVQGKTIYYTTLTQNPDLSQFDAVACLSEYAKHNTNLPERSVVISMGYDPTHIYPQKKVPKQCFYASSPDRGLAILLEAWPQVHAMHPDATLLVTYGGEIELPGVINLGEADEETMNEIYCSSDIWCHPCTGIELYCITGKKAQAAACIPVIIPAMALKETVPRGFFVEQPDDYAQTLIEVLGLPMSARDVIREDVRENAYTPTWAESTDKLLALIDSVL